MSAGPGRAAHGALAAALLAAGCAVGPNYHRPPLSPTAAYGALAVSPPERAPGAPTLVSGEDIPAQWWRVYHCAELDALVAQALANNPTVEAAKAALRVAREQVKAQKGAYFPTVAASLQPSHQQFARDLSSQTASGVSVYDLTTTQVTVTYTPDVFGANRRAVETLVAQADQQRLELEAARLTLASNVVVAAIQDAQYRAQIVETLAIIADQRATLASFERQAELGQASRADIAAQRALLAQVEATLPPLEKQQRVNRDLLAALVGRTPGEGPATEFAFSALTLPDQLPLSLPARLVEQRPDVRIAEEQLHAASAQVGVAVAARLPNIQIEGAAGGAALALYPMFGRTENFWSLTGTLTQPIFAGGTLLHRQKAAEAAYGQAAAQYRATVVGAFQNTADVLHALWTDADAQRASETAAAAAHASLEIARRQFALGDLSRLAVLSAEQADAQARVALVQAKANRYADVAALFQALGGGWWNAPAAYSGGSAAPDAKKGRGD
ncbi:MAG TPA: efflux transporter outer membrane subunit [Caulobacteraceae bacterium]|nr:efflux transporter outer membrane subunit [Caulobacteraceae bacterium]